VCVTSLLYFNVIIALQCSVCMQSGSSLRYRASVDFPATNRARGAGKRAGKAADCVSRVCKATATRRYAGGQAVLIRLLTRSSYIPTTRAVGRSAAAVSAVLRKLAAGRFFHAAPQRLRNPQPAIALWRDVIVTYRSRDHPR